MSGQEDQERVRSLLHATAGPTGPVRLDPVAARRVGDRRRLRRQAAGAAVASAMVLVVGLGSVFYAAHRSRGSVETGQGTVTARPSGSGLPGASLGTDTETRLSASPTPAVVGQPVRLSVRLVTAAAGGAVRVTWGDGQALPQRPAVCRDAAGRGEGAGAEGVQELVFGHTYAAPGSYRVVVQPGSACTGSAHPAAVLVLTVVPPARTTPGG